MGLWDAVPTRGAHQRVRQSDSASVPTRGETAGAARVGPRSEGKSRSRSKAAKGGSNRPAAKEAATRPAEQPEKQPASQEPSQPQVQPEAATSHSDGAASLQQTPSSQAELSPQTADNKIEGQAPEVKDDIASLQQEGFTEPQGALQTAQARKPKAARRRAAKSKGASLQIKPNGSSGSLSASSLTADSTSHKKAQEERIAAAEASAVVASAKPVTQPPKAEPILLRLSSQGHSAPQPVPDRPDPLQQSSSDMVENAPSSSSIAGTDLCGPFPPEAPSGQPSDAHPAPVSHTKATLQHGESGPDWSRPPLLHPLLPGSIPQHPFIQVGNQLRNCLGVP